MPIAVDVQQRHDALARATVAVAARRGAAGVTIRHVAAELGGSTTLVTNYLPTRSALLVNAVTWMLRGWEDERRAALAGVPERERLAALARWSSEATDTDDVIFRALLVELLTPRPAPGLAPFLHESRRHRADLEAAARDAGATDAAFAADAVYLLVRGLHFATIEEPGRWEAPAVHDVVDRLVGLLTPSA